MNRNHTTHRRPLRRALATVVGMGFGAAAAPACIVVCVDWGGPGCPPNGYNPFVPGSMPPVRDCIDRQPPYNCDMDGDGTDDAWCTPITLPNPGGGNFPNTDSCGNTLSLPCVPDPAGNGKGDDYYRPTWKKPGEMGPGTELGRCVYPCGQNTWKVGMCDSDGDGTPDKFTTSKWTSKDYKRTPAATDGWDMPTGKMRTFCKTIAQVATRGRPSREPMIIIGTEYADGATAASGYRIVDTVLVYEDLVDLANVPFDGSTIGATISEIRPDIDVIEEEDPMFQEWADPAPVATEHELAFDEMVDRGADEPRQLLFRGMIRNIDSVSHQYSVSFFGVNLEILDEPAPMWLAPGAEWNFEVRAVELVKGKAALASVAYANMDDINDPVTTVALGPIDFIVGDIDLDGAVGPKDLGLLLSEWGSVGEGFLSDLNGDGAVNATDLALLLGAWT